MKSLVEQCQELDRFYIRTGWNIEERIPTLRFIAGHGTRAKDTIALPDPRTVDPWAVDPKTVPGDTRRVATCPTCAGAKKVYCSPCVGSGRLRCNYCLGTGRSFGKKGLKQCPGCRGRGDRDCPNCTNGLHGCPSCDKLGRVIAWIEVTIQRKGTVCVLADVDIEQAHADLRQVYDFDRPASELATDLLADTGWRAVNSGWQLPRDLVPRLDLRTQRAIGIRVQSLCASTTRFTYSTRLATGTAELAGHSARFIEGRELAPLRTRAMLGLGAGAVTFISGLLVRRSYMSRSDWFSDHGYGDQLLALTVLGATAAALLTLGLCLPKRARSRTRWLAPILVMLASLLGVPLIWNAALPQAAVAEQALADGELQLAERELDGLADLGLESTDAQRLREHLADERGRRDDVNRLLTVRQAPSLSESAIVLRSGWHESAKRQDALALHAERARDAIEEAWRTANRAALLNIAGALDGLDDDLAARARALASLADIAASLQRSDLTSAAANWVAQAPPQATAEYVELERRFVLALESALPSALARGQEPTMSLEQRIEALGEVQDLLRTYQSVRGAEFDGIHANEIVRDKQRLERQFDKQREAEARRQAAAERKQQREAEAAQRAAERRSRAYRSLRCRDGTLSPTCTCGGSRRGCCSHHGGVAGCD
jgi:hypothetical protein